MEHKFNRDEEFRYEIEFANSQIELDVYRLLTILFSSKALHNANPPIYGFSMAAYQFERAEIYRIVFNLAIRARNILDKSTGQTPSVALKSVGKIEEDDILDELSFRESCNKIIHSEHINFGIIDPEDAIVHKGVTEFIYVYGKKSKKEWKATIDLIKFSETILQLNI